MRGERDKQWTYIQRGVDTRYRMMTSFDRPWSIDGDATLKLNTLLHTASTSSYSIDTGASSFGPESRIGARTYTLYRRDIARSKALNTIYRHFYLVTSHYDNTTLGRPFTYHPVEN